MSSIMHHYSHCPVLMLPYLTVQYDKVKNTNLSSQEPREVILYSLDIPNWKFFYWSMFLCNVVHLFLRSLQWATSGKIVSHARVFLRLLLNHRVFSLQKSQGGECGGRPQMSSGTEIALYSCTSCIILKK